MNIEIKGDNHTMGSLSTGEDDFYIVKSASSITVDI